MGFVCVGGDYQRSTMRRGHVRCLTHVHLRSLVAVSLPALSALSVCVLFCLVLFDAGAAPPPSPSQCFAMDKDQHTMTRPDVHQVYTLLPSNKAPMGVVEQPDGSYAFADARQQQQQQQQMPYQSPPHYGAQPAPGYPSVPRE